MYPSSLHLEDKTLGQDLKFQSLWDGDSWDVLLSQQLLARLPFSFLQAPNEQNNFK